MLKTKAWLIYDFDSIEALTFLSYREWVACDNVDYSTSMTFSGTRHDPETSQNVSSDDESINFNYYWRISINFHALKHVMSVCAANGRDVVWGRIEKTSSINIDWNDFREVELWNLFKVFFRIVQDNISFETDLENCKTLNLSHFLDLEMKTTLVSQSSFSENLLSTRSLFNVRWRY